MLRRLVVLVAFALQVAANAGLFAVLASIGALAFAAPNSPAPGVPATTHPGWRITKVAPPLVTRGEHGFSAIAVVVGDINKTRLVRYDGRRVVARDIAPDGGPILASYLEPDGTAIALSYSDHQVRSLAWPADGDPGDWQLVAAGVAKARGYRFGTETDDSGDIAVFLPSTGAGQDVAVYTPGVGWTEAAPISAPAGAGSLRALSLSPGGQLVGLSAMPGGTPRTILTKLTMPAAGTVWQTNDVVETNAPTATHIVLDAGRAGAIAYALNRRHAATGTRSALYLGEWAPGRIAHATVPPRSNFGPLLVTSINPGHARFVYRSAPGFSVLDGRNGNWDSHRYPAGVLAVDAASDDAGDIIVISTGSDRAVTAKGLVWPTGEASPRVSKIGTGLAAASATVLESGLGWGRFDQVGHPDAHRYATVRVIK